MAKELPYFKFFCSEWTDGDITLEDYRIQGLFINICSYYWSNNCDVSIVKLKKKFKQESETIDYLVREHLIKVNKEDVVISFLDEQLYERLETSKIKAKGGKASAEARRLKKLQQETNKDLTENEHVLNLCSTETQLLREDKKREEKKREEKIKEKKMDIITSQFWIQSICMQKKLTEDKVNLYLNTFLDDLELKDELDKDVKEIKSHFVNWLNIQMKDVKETKKTWSIDNY